MSIIKFGNEKLKKRLEKAGVVLEFITFYVDEPVDYNLHKVIAIEGMREIKEQCRLWALSNASKKLKFEDFFQVRIDDKEPIGRLIDIEDFIGNKNAFKERTSSTSWAVPNVDGYMTAFFNPPYDLRGELEEQKKLFNITNELLFEPMVASNLEIYEWSTDWSNFFDAGKEWWGAFYWTVYNKNKSFLIVVAASSTD